MSRRFSITVADNGKGLQAAIGSTVYRSAKDLWSALAEFAAGAPGPLPKLPRESIGEFLQRGGEITRVTKKARGQASILRARRVARIVEAAMAEMDL